MYERCGYQDQLIEFPINSTPSRQTKNPYSTPNNPPVPNPLLDPTLQLVRLSDGATIATNDNWEDNLEQKTLIESTGIPPSDSREPAMVTSVDPGAYSFVIRGAGDTTGFATLEIYEFAE